MLMLKIIFENKKKYYFKIFFRVYLFLRFKIVFEKI